MNLKGSLAKWQDYKAHKPSPLVFISEEIKRLEVPALS